MGSPQTLSEADRRIVAAWAADCAERVLELFEAEAPGDSRPRDAIARTRAFSRGELGIADEIRRRFVAGGAAREVSARRLWPLPERQGRRQASLIWAHTLWGQPRTPPRRLDWPPPSGRTVNEEVRWQLGRMSAATRAALRQVPLVGENSSGPLGPGLLASGLLGTIIRDLQAGLADPDDALRPRSKTR
jgi:hypothetical protein